MLTSEYLIAMRSLTDEERNRAMLALLKMVKAGRRDTHILRLFRQYRAVHQAAAETAGQDKDEEFDQIFYQHTTRIVAEMMALPSTSAADVAAKMLVAHSDGDFSCLDRDDPVWVEARKLTGLEA